MRESGEIDERDELRREIASLGKLLETRSAERDQAEEALRAARKRDAANADVVRATAEILRAIAGRPGDVDGVLQLIAETSAGLFGAASVSIQIAEGLEFVREYRVGAIAKRIGSAYPRSNIRVGGRNLPGTVVAEDRQIHIPDLDDLHPSMADWPGLPHARAGGTRTLSGTPLRREGKSIGALIVFRDQLRPFTQDELALQQTFADQAAIAVANARLMEAERTRSTELAEALKRQAATSEILRVISQSPTDAKPVFNRVVETATKLLRCDYSIVMLTDGRVWWVEAVAVPEGAVPEKTRDKLPVDASANFPSRAILSKQMLHLPDWGQIPLPEHEASVRGRLGITSSVHLPLISAGECIGVFVLASKSANAFAPADIAQAESFRDQALIAVENARLFEQVQAKTRDLTDALVHQTASGSILRVIASSPTTVTPALQAIVESACDVCGAYDAAVILREGDRVRFSAHRGPIPVGLETWPLNRGWVGGRAIVDRTPVHVRDLQLAGEEFPDGRDFALRMGHRTILAVPLLHEGESIGAIVVRRNEADPFTEKQIELLRIFADQAVIAIGNVRLFDEVQARTRDGEEALARQTATAEVLKTISRSAFDLDAVLGTLVSSAGKLCAADGGIIWLRQGEKFHAGATYGLAPEATAFVKSNPRGSNDKSIVPRVLRSGKTEHVRDRANDPEFSFPGLDLPDTLLGVPMVRNGRIDGVFTMHRRRASPFSARQIELFETFADQAVIAIENARLFSEVQAKTRDLEEALAQQTATAEVLQVISRSAFGLKSVLQTLVDSAVRLCAEDGVIYLRDGDLFRAEAAFGAETPGSDPRNRSPRRAGRDSVTGRVALSGRVEQIPDNEADPEFQVAPAQRMKMRALLGVPLLSDGKVEGVFVLAKPEPGLFSERAVEVVRTFADQAVIAIQNVRLFEEVRARTREVEEALARQTATSEVLKTISRSAFDVKAVLETLIASAVQLSGADHGSIAVRDGAVFRFRAFWPEGVDGIAVGAEVPVASDTLLGRAFLSRKPEEIEDVSKIPNYPHPVAGLLSRLVTPMLRDDDMIGGIALMRRAPGRFPQRTIELVQTFADQAVIAIGNAQLFEEVRARTREVEEALAQQTATSDVLKAISRSAFDLDAVLKTLVDSARDLCRASIASISVVDRDFLRFRALAGGNPEFANFLRDNPFPVAAPTRANNAGRVLLAKAASYVEDVVNEPDYAFGEAPRLGGFRSLLGVPLMRDGEVIGVFQIGAPEPGALSPRQIDLVAAFADQAVIAIENARLIEEVRARTREVEEALAQQTATAEVLKTISRSAFDLQKVLDTLIASAAPLAGADSGLIYLQRDDTFYVQAHFDPGSEPEFMELLKSRPQRPGRGSVGARVLLSGEIVHVPDNRLDPDYDPALRAATISRAVLGVPLKRDGAIVGAIALARREPGLFSGRQIELARTFADQAVIAIENARLLGEVQARTRELEQSLSDLHKAQDRLIQSEKLASLGQLTAGIAHEIKNPLNFVNNFSALSRELLEELRETLQRLPEQFRADADELMGMIDSNLEKVASHGKRADSIVKNMLLHSREGSGERTRVNVNAMVDEALNLGYHGARAEKPGFNVTLEKFLDPQAGDAELHAQEITRVLLNLVSNGFYACAKRRDAEGGDYAPTLRATTRDLGGQVEIRIRDNGTGVPDEVRAKMFNPFFTTKPAGEGTGLGLSLSHDIVVKQHGGTLDVDTELGAFAEFVITLPRKGEGK